MGLSLVPRIRSYLFSFFFDFFLLLDDRWEYATFEVTCISCYFFSVLDIRLKDFGLSWSKNKTHAMGFSNHVWEYKFFLRPATNSMVAHCVLLFLSPYFFISFTFTFILFFIIIISLFSSSPSSLLLLFLNSHLLKRMHSVLQLYLVIVPNGGSRHSIHGVIKSCWIAKPSGFGTKSFSGTRSLAYRFRSC